MLFHYIYSLIIVRYMVSKCIYKTTVLIQQHTAIMHVLGFGFYQLQAALMDVADAVLWAA